MYIRQTCLLSFEEVMQYQQETRLEKVFQQIDVSKISSALLKPSYSRGPKGFDPSPMMYAFLAMHLEKMATVKQLVENLKHNPVLRYCCGFEVLGKVPSESTFSRFYSKLTEIEELDQMFHALVIKAKSLDLVDGTHVSIDSTKLAAYEAPQPKKNIIADGLHPNWGMKRDTNGNNIRWFGWKLHILCDSKSELPMEICMTPANVHDGTIALKLIDQFLNNYRNIFKPSYYAMDSGYDYENIYREIIDTHQAIPIIAYNPRGSKAPPQGYDEDLHPVCSGGYKLVYWGKDQKHMKFRCPHILNKCECLHGSNWCSPSNYGYTRKINFRENPRLLGYPIRSSNQWKLLYNLRTSVERCNSRLKEMLNVDRIRSKGIKKAKVHALLNCVVLVAGTIAANI